VRIQNTGYRIRKEKQMKTIWNDMRYGLRQMRKSPGFTAVAVLSLALGIGANTAIFGFLDRLLLRPLPAKKPHELVIVKHRLAQGGTNSVFSYPFYRGLRDQSEEMFSGLIAHWWGEVNLSVGDSQRKALGAAVSTNYFSVLGVKPTIGRGFLVGEDQAPGGHPVAIISHGLWKRQFDGDPSVVGKTIRLDGYPLTIVGVAPRGFAGTEVGLVPSVYVPLKMWANIDNPSLLTPGWTWLSLLWRLEPGMSYSQAQAALRVAAKRIHVILSGNNAPTEMLVADGSRGIGAQGSLRLRFTLLQVVTAFILLVACANVANMLLARGMTRQKEIAIRRAMGASRGGIVRQLLTESVLLTILGGACGVLLAHWLSNALRSALATGSSSTMPVGVDGRILIFALLVSLWSVLIFGLIPALQVSRSDPIVAIKDDVGAVTMLGRRRNLRSSLVVVQVALSVVALAFGGLFIRSLVRLRFMDPGFDASRVLGVSVNFEHERAKGLDQQQFFSDLKERVETFPGVQTVSLAAKMPLGPRGMTYKTSMKYIENFQIPSDPNFKNSWQFEQIGPGYFKTLGVPFVQGREFSVQDGPGAAKVMIINELVAKLWWPNQNPIAKRVTLFGGEVREVVGVVRAAKLYSIRDERIPTMFLPVAQPMEWKTQSGLMGSWAVKPVLLVRTSGNPKAVASLLRSELDTAGLNPAAYDIRTSAEHAWDSLNEQRIMTGILNIVGSVGLVFVATGVFSVMAFEIDRRTREIGIRMALGAQRADVRRLILRKGAILTGLGLGLGIVFSLLPLRLLIHFLPDIHRRYGDLLYGVHIWDPLTHVAVALLVALIALAACWLPARRAARIDPMEALRYE
jgi:predicted permease